MTEMRDWAGRTGDSWASEWRRTDLSFSNLATKLDAAILAVAPKSGTAIDIGCGAGATAIALAEARPSLTVIGRDISPQLVEAARARGAGHANLRFEAGDATDLTERGVDLFCSRHGVMFFDDPVAAFGAFRRAAAPDAAFVFSCFRSPALNPWAAETVAAAGGSPPPPPPAGSEPPPGPFAFADPTRVERILTASGWRGEPQAVDYRYRAGEGPDAVEEALALFSRIGPSAMHLASLDDDARAAGRDRLRAFLASREVNGAVDFPAAAWVWTCHAVEQGGTA
ncbi:MAG: class I SAM-dependent methyltransferase [Sphingomonas sp.]|uniref:class I SAM-dependent methyltransferase n=1 Tax=Sphingomonas sp. TaxID=28214 RepID=UPI001AC254CE|nr:class I SAM-dependent methyltransferase [Sphingomonas sp.]MBN8807433.1 class I SAM-dependent methyltransferase [Sphingomonas sp.]